LARSVRQEQRDGSVETKWRFCEVLEYIEVVQAVGLGHN